MGTKMTARRALNPCRLYVASQITENFATEQSPAGRVLIIRSINGRTRQLNAGEHVLSFPLSPSAFLYSLLVLLPRLSCQVFQRLKRRDQFYLKDILISVHYPTSVSSYASLPRASIIGLVTYRCK